MAIRPWSAAKRLPLSDQSYDRDEQSPPLLCFAHRAYISQAVQITIGGIDAGRESASDFVCGPTEIAADWAVAGW